MKQKLLYVDDEAMNHFVLRTVLRSEYEVDAVGTAREAMSCLETYPYSVVLIDINLGRGEINGTELMKRIRTKFSSPQKIVALTAYALPGDRERFLELGFDDYVSKPINRNELLKKLAAYFLQL